jgi:hypothetical protein
MDIVYDLLDYDGVKSCRNSLTFQGKVLAPALRSKSEPAKQATASHYRRQSPIQMLVCFEGLTIKRADHSDRAV